MFELFIYIFNLILDTFFNVFNPKKYNQNDNLVYYPYKIENKPNGYKNTYASSIQNYE